MVLVENEGNARLTSSAPKIHIAVAGIEKLIPRAQDLGVFLNAAGAQRHRAAAHRLYFVSFRAPARGGNRWSGRILSWSCWTTAAPSFWPTLRNANRYIASGAARVSIIARYIAKSAATIIRGFIRGPIGAIITPQFHGVLKDPWLPFASSLCGACAEVCPVKIEIPEAVIEAARGGDGRAAPRRLGRDGTVGFQGMGLGDGASRRFIECWRVAAENSWGWRRRWGRWEIGRASERSRSLPKLASANGGAGARRNRELS